MSNKNYSHIKFSKKIRVNLCIFSKVVLLSSQKRNFSQVCRFRKLKFLRYSPTITDIEGSFSNFPD